MNNFGRLSNRYGESESPTVEQIKIYKFGKLFIPGQVHSNRSRRGRGGYSRGALTSDRAGLISKIHHLLEIHRTRRQINAIKITKCSPNLHRAILRAIRSCFEEKIFDSRLYPVGELFLELFHCNGNFNAIYSLLMGDHLMSTSHIKNNALNILYPKHLSSENSVAFEYYINHVSNLRDEEYEWNNGKFLDIVNHEIDHYSRLTPLSAAVQKRDPALVLILLRYGADPFQRTDAAFLEYREWDATEQLIDDLNGLCLFKNTGFSAETREKLASEEAIVLQCLSYFRRAVPSIKLTSSNHVYTTNDEEDTPESGVPPVNKSVTARVYNLLPSLAVSFDMSFFQPTSSLKQQCRCVIRQRLRENRRRMTSLPRGISLLPLPKPLRDYVDLQTD